MSEQLPDKVGTAGQRDQEKNETIGNNGLIEKDELIEKLKTSGNDHFKKGELFEAIQDYQQALRYCGPESQALSATLHSNIAIVMMKMEDNAGAIESCKRALKQDPLHLKSQTNLAICEEKIGKIEEALESYKSALKLSKQDQYINAKVQSLQKEVAVLNEKRKEEVLAGLKGIGNSLLGFFGMSLDNFKMEQGPSGGYTISTKK